MFAEINVVTASILLLCILNVLNLDPRAFHVELRAAPLERGALSDFLSYLISA